MCELVDMIYVVGHSLSAVTPVNELILHPGVAEMAVIGMATMVNRSRSICFITLKPELKFKNAKGNRTLHILEEIIILGDLPRTKSGKFRSVVLKAHIMLAIVRITLKSHCLGRLSRRSLSVLQTKRQYIFSLANVRFFEGHQAAFRIGQHATDYPVCCYNLIYEFPLTFASSLLILLGVRSA
ncbi:hypothetical protein BDQ17DRAFT_681762 [Cyathus striatus]|nr:hypothetical protein BDQ17DRAFT_681762 [Cyathus striatus]